MIKVPETPPDRNTIFNHFLVRNKLLYKNQLISAGGRYSFKILTFDLRLFLDIENTWRLYMTQAPSQLGVYQLE